jgi:hypothetical protein
MYQRGIRKNFNKYQRLGRNALRAQLMLSNDAMTDFEYGIQEYKEREVIMTTRAYIMKFGGIVVMAATVTWDQVWPTT